jgi:hypothetical protein
VTEAWNEPLHERDSPLGVGASPIAQIDPGAHSGVTHPHALLRLVSSTALRISCVTASGCDTMDACDAATSSIRAFPRSAMNRCPAGGMARSSVPSRSRWRRPTRHERTRWSEYQRASSHSSFFDGLVAFQAANCPCWFIIGGHTGQ